MRYAVALLNYFDNVNKLAVVDGATPVDAMIRGAKVNMGLDANDADNWLDSLYGEDVEEIQTAFFDYDMSISLPVPLD
jgi:hypothetical protein